MHKGLGCEPNPRLPFGASEDFWLGACCALWAGRCIHPADHTRPLSAAQGLPQCLSPVGCRTPRVVGAARESSRGPFTPRCECRRIGHAQCYGSVLPNALCCIRRVLHMLSEGCGRFSKEPAVGTFCFSFNHKGNFCIRDP